MVCGIEDKMVFSRLSSVRTEGFISSGFTLYLRSVHLQDYTHIVVRGKLSAPGNHVDIASRPSHNIYYTHIDVLYNLKNKSFLKKNVVYLKAFNFCFFV